MTIKAWNIEHEWQEPFVAKLTDRGATPHVVDAALSAIDDRCTATGKAALELFGEPTEYAQNVILPNTEAAKESQLRAIGLAVLGLIGMFVALWGWTGHVRSSDSVLGMNPWIVVVIGLVLCVGAAIADLALGNRADFSTSTPGTQQSGRALLVNRLAPWIIVALTLIGMLIIWLRYR
ncbi:DUF1129 domain-containing protein [Calidifontibacter terrae]